MREAFRALEMIEFLTNKRRIIIVIIAASLHEISLDSRLKFQIPCVSSSIDTVFWQQSMHNVIYTTVLIVRLLKMIETHQR